MNFDDQPVGQHTKMAVAEHPTEEDESSNKTKPSGPLTNRLTSKNPKVRLDAMTELLNLFTYSEPDTEAVLTHYTSFPKYLADKHPGVQEKAIDCFLLVLAKSPNSLDKILADCLKTLLEKCITSAKAQTRAKSAECFLVLAETESAHVLIKESLKEYLSLKTAPKVSSGATSILTQLTGSFGSGYFAVREFGKLVSNLGESTNAQVRAEVMSYLKEAYKWDKDSILKEIEKLRPAQQEELKKQYAEMVEPGKPSKFVKGKENLPEEVKEVTTQTTKDSYATAAEVVVLKKFNDQWCSQIMQAKKWSEKRDKLEELLKAISVERIKSENFSELGKTLKLLLQDPNIVVVNLVLKVIGQLAKSLRSSFAGYSKLTFDAVVQKLKDRKSAAEAQKCIENLMYSLRIEDMLEQVKEALNDKSPLVKAKICVWIESAVLPMAESGCARTLAEELGPVLVRLSDDAASEVRENALACLGSMAKAVGPDAGLDRLTSELNAQKQGRIKQMQFAQENREVQKAVESQPKALNDKKSEDILKKSVSKKQLTAVKEKIKRVSTEDVGAEEDVGIVISLEEADKLVTESVPEEICTLLNAKDWKERQKGFQDLSEWVKESKTQALLEPLLVLAKAKLNGFKESNPGLLKSGLALIQVLADTLTFDKKLANEFVPSLVDKMGDAKFSTPCADIVMLIADAANPTFVVNLLMKACNSSKSPNVIKASITLLARMLDEYTASNIPVKATVDFAKHYLNHTNSQIRNTAISYLAAVYGAIGDLIQSWLADNVKDSVRKTIEAEFAKVKPQTAGESRRNLKGESAEQAAKNRKKDVLESLAPRANISALVTSKILADLEDAAMKHRQEAKDAIEKILSAASYRIVPNGLSPLFSALKGRMSEPCKNLAKGFIALVGNLAVAMGAGFKQYGKIVQPLMYNLTDKQSAIHGETMVAIDKVAGVTGPEFILNNVPVLLEKDNPEMRGSLLSWVLKNKEHLEKCEVQAFVGPLITVMQDRAKEIRTLAEQVVKEVIVHTGYQSFTSLIQDLKPVVRMSLESIIDKYIPKKPEEAKNDKRESVLTETKEEATDKTQEAQEKTTKANANEESNAVVEVQNNDASKEEGNIEEPLNKEVDDKRATRTVREELSTTKNRLPPSFKHGKSPPQKPKNLANSRSSMERSPGEMASSKSTSNLQKRFEGRPKEVKKISRKLSRTGKKVTSQSPSRSRVDSSSNGCAVETVVMCTIGNKEKRDEADRQMRWSATEIREDHVEKLKKALRNVINPNLFDLMFSGQFKKNLAAINALTEGLKSEFAAIVDLFDLFCKWVTMKLIDQSNTAMTKSVMEFLVETFRRMEESGYVMYEFEAGSILPVLCERMSTVSKEQIKGLIKCACSLYSPSKVAGHIVNTLETTKNLKTKVECLAMLRELSATFGSSKICSAKSIKIAAKLIGAPDKAIKGEAVELLAEAYRCRGDSVWAAISRIPEKHKELLTARFSTVTLEEAEQTPYCSASTVNVNESAQKKVLAENTNKTNGNKLNEMRDSLHIEKTSRVLGAEKSVDRAENKLSATGRPSLKEGLTERIDEDVERIMEVLRTGEISKRVDALMCLNEKVISNSAKDKEVLVNCCDELFRTFTIVLRDTFDKEVSEIPIRFSKYFMTVVSKICADKSITKKLTIGPYLAFAEQLLTKLLYDGLEKLGENSEGEYLIKTFNSTMLRLLENCDPTNSFNILIMLFKSHKNEPEMVSNIKMAKLPNLIVKCILKLTKVMDSFISFLDVPSLILCIYENLLTDLRRTVNDDIGIRMAKTIINELVKAKGEKIWDAYRAAEAHIKNDDHIRRWIGIILENTRPCDTSTGHSEELREAMKKLSAQNTFKDGIKALGEFVARHKTVDLEPHFAPCSKDFRDYVMESLKTYLEEEGAAANEESKELKEEQVELRLSDGPRSSLLEYKSKLALLKQKFGVTDKDKNLSKDTI